MASSIQEAIRLSSFERSSNEVARSLPRKAQEMLGYAVHDAIASGGGYLGMVGLRDPVELMAEGKL